MIRLEKYLGKELVFTADGWINATQTAKAFRKKRLDNFLASKSFTEYCKALSELSSLKISELKKTVLGKGKEQGTYLHPYLVVVFARWIDARFAVWCDLTIRAILIGDLEVKYKNLKQAYNDLEDKAFDRYEIIRLYQTP